MISPAAGKLGYVALDVELALLAVRGCRQRHVLEHARAAALGDPLDHAALAGRVAALEDHDHAGALGHPGLQPRQLDLQLVSSFSNSLPFILRDGAAAFAASCFFCLFFSNRIRSLTATRCDSLATVR